MNDYLSSIILGAIEGLTEFLPVSSTGHMIIAYPLLGESPEAPTWRVFTFVSQLGAILAVVIYFWRDLWQRVFKPVSRQWKDHIITKLAVAMAPTIVLALLLEDYVETYIETQANGPPATALALIVGALAILWIDKRYRFERPMEIEDVSLKQAFMIGIIQVISMWPGVSRSGATIMGGMVLGLSPRVATEFSFYLAIPTMVAAGGWRLLKYHEDLTADVASVVSVGTAVAFVVALGVVALFMRYVRRRKFTPFAVYRIGLGVLVLLAWSSGWMNAEAL